MSKSERVKVSRPSVKGVLAFFLLPQFWRCFGHFSHIGPTFVRTLALMLEQAGLLPINHPATRYNGTSPDGKRITVRAVMGEAWFHLRTRKDVGVYQWSMFSSIVMMFAIFVGAIAMATIYVVSGSIAQAQIFNLAAPTDLTTVPSYGGANGFDTRDPATIAGTSGDLAIGILDKVLRQGATGRGGPLQDGIAAMYGTYSSAVLIIAAILVFWSIVSIVVDSARTGQFGGGRHNMVWTPIRFVFALGLLVPIGGGFSSGQMLVMKLAELGSNLGTNMWVTYVTGTVSGDMLVSDLQVRDPENAVSPYLDAIVCMKKENIAVEVSKGGNINYAGLVIPTPITYPPLIPPTAIDGDLVVEYPDVAAHINGEDTYAINIGTAANHTKCGSYSFSNPYADFLNGTVPAGTPIPAGATGQAAYHVPDRIAQFKKAVRIAEINAMQSIKADMELFACAIAGKEQPSPLGSYNLTCPNGVNFSMASYPVGPFPAGSPLEYLNPVPTCAAHAGGWSGNYPSTGCRELIITKYAVNLHNAIYGPGGAKEQYLNPYMDGSAAVSLIDDAAADGWAGMGAWYYGIAKINRVVSSSQNPNGNGGSGGDNSGDNAEGSDACFWPIEDTFLCTLINITSTIWNNVNSIDKLDELRGAFTSGGFVKVVLNLLQDGDSVLLTSLGQWGQNTHPIAQISATGEAILNKSLNMYNTMMLISLLAGLPFVGGIAETVMSGPIGGLLGMLASFGMLPAITLLYYVPLIPWIRVMFAVLAWIVSVVEAVTTMPIVALAHLRTDGEGLAGPMAQSAYTAWLNLLLRPGLTVIGFVMGGLIFQAMVLYSNDTFTSAMSSIGTGGFGILDQVMNTYMYVMVMYALVNASFKLVDIIPNSTMGWLGGGPGAQSFEGADEIIRSGINEIGSEFARTASDFAGNSVRHYFREDPKDGTTKTQRRRAKLEGKISGFAGWSKDKASS